jgi:hypothetical protein
MASPSTASTMGAVPHSIRTLVASVRWVIRDVATVPVSTDQSRRSRAKDSSAVIILTSSTPSSSTGRNERGVVPGVVAAAAQVHDPQPVPPAVDDQRDGFFHGEGPEHRHDAGERLPQGRLQVFAAPHQVRVQPDARGVEHDQLHLFGIVREAAFNSDNADVGQGRFAFPLRPPPP